MTTGLVLPPTLAPHQVVIVPIYKTLEQRDEIGRHVEPLIAELKKRGIRVRYDDADNKKPGWKSPNTSSRVYPYASLSVVVTSITAL